MNIPQTGPNGAKEKFFRECSSAFEFLAVFYTLTKEQQLDLMQYLTKLKAKPNP